MTEIKIETYDPDTSPTSESTSVIEVNGRRVRVERWAADNGSGIEFVDAETREGIETWLGEQDEDGGVAISDVITDLHDEIDAAFGELYREHVLPVMKWAAAEALRVMRPESSEGIKPPAVATVICYRRPDASNEFDTFGPKVDIFDFDYGYMDLHRPEELFPWMASHFEAVDDDPATTDEVREAVEGAVLDTFTEYLAENERLPIYADDTRTTTRDIFRTDVGDVETLRAVIWLYAGEVDL